jgi:hypothetical protein
VRGGGKCTHDSCTPSDNSDPHISPSQRVQDRNTPSYQELTKLTNSIVLRHQPFCAFEWRKDRCRKGSWRKKGDELELETPKPTDRRLKPIRRHATRYPCSPKQVVFFACLSLGHRWITSKVWDLVQHSILLALKVRRPVLYGASEVLCCTVPILQSILTYSSIPSCRCRCRRMYVYRRPICKQAASCTPHVLWHLLYLTLPLEIKIRKLSGIKHLRSQQTLT